MKTVEPIRDLKTIRIMRSYLRDQSLRNELLFILGINVGLRISDILKLTFDDVMNFKSMSAKEYVTITEKKTSKTKKFYIGSIVSKLIEGYASSLVEVLPDMYVFCSKKSENKPISRQHAWYILNNAAEMIGLVERDHKGNIISGEVGTHTMRKTFGYHAYTGGTTIELLMDIFNHSSKTQTLRYIGITEDQKKEVYMQSNLG
ncbi:tyrosine-type recombinase/integrase [Clostridium tagluense]|uniref:tyrosine-type recombinase/integrase n=1 Tax=Clostridium tagluense TaxID=360422 RepID=UPI001CF37FC3|nr:tyrosine-type recombinase/integrase [Clostridium tagluense]MCB2313265.1 tyrosine-type recombinase/integrase [Clostridium tagluense]MCB2317984.1 tyrosine-type recombinase/integrase [Clostridium tagluense]MCB2322820.1 tyrosine-type recombinase/integrase [Clostridium tagluense]MCB2327768.1 tyrosine-type recombinase/integrase [Clostridium tagluense]MCB2332415.1 tyrosine-type recombinase/integrase [Clostridium tagluense]